MRAGDFDMRSESFEQLLTPDSRVEKIADGMVFTEGPVWFAEGDYLLFSDIRGNQIKRWSAGDGLATWREPSGHANGHTRDRQGRLVTAGHISQNVTRTEADGSITVLAESYQGKRLNAPNDVVVKSDGTIWFTDPPGGRRLPGFENVPVEQPKNYVFRLDPESRRLTPVVEDLQSPNGLCFSPDERLLYIADSANRRVQVFDVQGDNTLANWRLFVTIEPGIPDGIRVDAQGRLYSTAEDGVHVFSPEGELLGKILVEQTPANCAFGGRGRHDLFITAQQSVYRVTLASTGSQEP